VPREGLVVHVNEMLADIQAALLVRATSFRDAHIHDPKDYAGLCDAVQDGWAFSFWCEGTDCEAKVKEDTKATTRCIPLDQKSGEGKCIVCGRKSKRKVYFSRAY
jgi:prolyl-tRNA synthetase